MLRKTQLGFGRMGEKVANFPWSDTQLGDISVWSEALRACVELMLGQQQAICIFWGPENTLLYNDAYAPILGAKEENALGKPASEVWMDVWADILPFVQKALAGEGMWFEELPLIMTRNGYPEETFWTFSYSPLYDQGEIAGMINVAYDATPAVVAREKAKVLQGELIHRVKNTLTIASVIVSSSLKDVDAAREAKSIITGRINALGKAQNLINSSEDNVDLEALILAACEAHADRKNRIKMRGEPVVLASQQAIGISLAVYELATNALKYGAFSTECGAVAIHWSNKEDGGFEFEWREHGGPPVAPPKRSGFGSNLMNRVVAGYFDGEGEIKFEPTGVCYTLRGRLPSRTVTHDY